MALRPSGAPSDRSHARLLELLVQHTRGRNIKWNRLSEQRFVFQGENAAVAIEAMDDEGNRLRFIIGDKNGRVQESFVTEPISAPGEVYWDDQVRELWDLLNPGRDPVRALISELENIPPF